MGYLAGLPDISDEDWLAYSSDQFMRQTQPNSDALKFMAITSGAQMPILDLQQRAEQMAPVAPPPPPPMQLGNPSQWNPMQSVAGPPAQSPDTYQPSQMPEMSAQGNDWDGISTISDMSGTSGLNQPGGPIGPPGPPSGPGGGQQNQQPGFWQGTNPGQPNAFSAIGAEAQRGAEALRRTGATNVPVIGPIAGAAAQYATDVFQNLGGTAEALRQGNLGLGGAAGGVLQATVGEQSPLGFGKYVGTEAQWPTSIPSEFFPPAMQPLAQRITPETPIVGGLTNPRELAGLVPQMIAPETALERGVGGLVGRGVTKGLESAAPVLDRLSIPSFGEGDLAYGAYAGGVRAPGRALTQEAGAGQVPLGEALPIGVYFSKLGRAIEELPQERMTLQQAQNALLKKGVKPEEMRWTGLEDLLSSGPGNTPITKTQLRQQFEQGRVEMRETVYEQTRGTPEYEAAKAEYDLYDRRAREARARSRFLNERLMNGDQSVRQEAADALEEEQVLAQAREDARLRLQSQPLPEQDPNAPSPRYLDYVQHSLEQQAGMSALGMGEPVPGYREILLSPQGREISDEGFESTHWPGVDNPVLHARVSDRTLPDGRKVLHVEELQSDWHQQGREQGYRPDRGTVRRTAEEARPHVQAYVQAVDANAAYDRAAREERSRLSDMLERANTYGKDIEGDDTLYAAVSRLQEMNREQRDHTLAVMQARDAMEQWASGDPVKQAALSAAQVDEFNNASEALSRQFGAEQVRNNPDLWPGGLPEGATVTPDLEYRAQALRAQANAAERNFQEQMTNVRDMIPRGPFEKTQKWTELGMKRLLRMASEEGYDALSWTPGRIHAERYGQMIQANLDRVEYNPLTQELLMKTRDGYWDTIPNIQAHDLHSYIGESAADALMAREYEPSAHMQEAGTGPDSVLALSGDELANSMYGSRGFGMQYDTVMPQAMANILKPWKTRDYMGEIELQPLGERSPAHIVDITPEMRAHINEQGFPLFAAPPGGGMRGLESPFFSPARTGRQAATDIGLGVAGGVAGAATAPEDATWEERAKRAAVGAAAGAMAGPLARAPRGALALARRGIEDIPFRATEGGVPESAAGGTPPLPPSPASAVPEEIPEPGDAIERALRRMTPEGRAAAQRFGSEVSHRAPWMEGIVERSAQPPTAGGGRYQEILDAAKAEPVGDDVAAALDAANEPAPYEPPRKEYGSTKRQAERLGGGRALATQPEHLQELNRVGNEQIRQQLVEAHGFRSEADSREAAARVMEHILPFAREARPNEPVNEALLRAGREAWAQSLWPAYYSHLELQKALADPDVDAGTRDALQQASDYWEAVRQVLGRYAGEIAPSEAGRTFRSMQDLPRGIAPEIAGGSEEAVAEINRAKLTPREKAYADIMSRMRTSRKGVQAGQSTAERAAERSQARVAGRRTNGDMANMGLEWSDVMARDPGATGPATDAELTRMMAGLADLGGYRARRDLLPEAMKLNLDDRAAVDAFWKSARKRYGLDESGVPFKKFDPNVSGQSYLGGADTITRDQALRLVSKTIIKDIDTATAAVREARLSGAPAATVRDLEARAAEAYARAGLNIDRWPPESFPVVSKAADSVRARIEREWPKDRPAGSGLEEDVAKKRQLLGVFDQEIRKQQKYAGLPVTGIQDLLSYGTSNVLMTNRFIQASMLESLTSALNEPLQSVLRGKYGEAGQQLAGMARAVGLPTTDDMLKLGEGIKAPALVNAMKGLRDIGPMEAAGEMRDVATKGAGLIKSDSPNPLMKFLAPMHRVSRGISEAFQTMNYFAEVNRLANQVSETGILPGGKRIEQFVDEATGQLRNPTPAELLGNLPQEMVDEALKKSKTINEGGEVQRFEKWIGDAKGMLNKPNATGAERTQGILANLLFPFVYGLRPAIMSGFGVLSSPVKHPFQIARALQRGDTSEAVYVAKKMALAHTFLGYMAYNTMAGNITGHGPADTGTRQALMEATDENGDPVWRPDSIRIPNPGGGHTWVKYTSMPGPVSMVGTVMGNMYEAYAYDGKAMESTPELAGRMVNQILPSIIDNTFFRDMVNVVEAMNANGGAFSMSRTLGQIGSRFIPASGALRMAATVTDPYNRLTTGPLTEAMSGIPGLRQQLPAQVSPYTGRAVEQPLNPITALGGISGNVYASPSQPNQAAAEVADVRRRRLPLVEGALSGQRPSEVAGPNVRTTPRTFTRGEQSRGLEFGGAMQTGEGIRGAQEAFGQATAQQLGTLLNDPAYQRLPPEQKALRLQAAMNAGEARGTYPAEGAPGITLSPQNQLDRNVLGRPQYQGVSGSPDQIAEQNQRISSARNALAQLSSRYGRARAMGLLASQNPEAFRLATAYPPLNRDLLWLQEQQEQQALGFNEEDLGVNVPDFGSGSDVIGGAGSGLFRAQSVPPSLRGMLR